MEECAGICMFNPFINFYTMTELKRNKTISGQEDSFMAISTVNGSRAVARQALLGGGGGCTTNLPY